MPIYEFRCEKGHQFEVMQRMSDDPVTECPVHGVPVERVFHPIAVHFKGSGFYNTDYGTRKRSREKESHDGAAAKAAKDSKDSKDSSSKSESKDSSKSDSGGKSKPSESATTATASSSKSD